MIFWILFLFHASASELPTGLTEPYHNWWQDSAQLEEKGLSDAALVKIRGVRRGHPDFMPALLAEARILESQGRFEQALNVLEERPFEPNAMEARARILLSLERWDEAIVLLDYLQAYGWVNAWFLKAKAMTPLDAIAAAVLLEQALTHIEGTADDLEITDALLWVGNALLKEGEAANGPIANV